jgi:hypothetical protein
VPAERASDLPRLVRAWDEACAAGQDGAICDSHHPPPGPSRCIHALPLRPSQKASAIWLIHSQADGVLQHELGLVFRLALSSTQPGKR